MSNKRNKSKAEKPSKNWKAKQTTERVAPSKTSAPQKSTVPGSQYYRENKDDRSVPSKPKGEWEEDDLSGIEPNTNHERPGPTSTPRQTRDGEKPQPNKQRRGNFQQQPAAPNISITFPGPPALEPPKPKKKEEEEGWAFALPDTIDVARQPSYFQQLGGLLSNAVQAVNGYWIGRQVVDAIISFVSGTLKTDFLKYIINLAAGALVALAVRFTNKKKMLPELVIYLQRQEDESPLDDYLAHGAVQRHPQNQLVAQVPVNHTLYKYKFRYGVSVLTWMCTIVAQKLSYKFLENVNRFYTPDGNRKTHMVNDELFQSSISNRNINGHLPKEQLFSAIERTVNNRSDTKLVQDDLIDHNTIESTTTVIKYLVSMNVENVRELGFQSGTLQQFTSGVIESSETDTECCQDPPSLRSCLAYLFPPDLQSLSKRPWQYGARWVFTTKALSYLIRTLQTNWDVLLEKSNAVRLMCHSWYMVADLSRLMGPMVKYLPTAMATPILETCVQAQPIIFAILVGVTLTITSMGVLWTMMLFEYLFYSKTPPKDRNSSGSSSVMRNTTKF